MTTIQNKIEDTKNEIGNVLHHHRCSFVNVRALQAIRDERLAQMTFNLQQHPAPDVLHIPNSTSSPFLFIQTEEAQVFASIQATLAVWENAPEFLEAEGIIQPLLDELATLEAAKLAADQAEAQRIQAIADRKAEALAEAAAKIEAEFAEPSEPAPFRGKGLKTALATA